MNISELLAGLVSGILLTFLGFIAKNYFIPWFRDFISDNLDLSGKWHCHVKNPGGNIQEMTMILKQRGNLIKGNISIIKYLINEKLPEIKEYKVSGEIKTRLVVLNAYNTQKQAMGVHTELLEIIDGNILKGLGLWFSATQKVIQSNQFEWNRIITNSKKHIQNTA